MNAKRFTWYAPRILLIVSMTLLLAVSTSFAAPQAGTGDPQTPVYSDPSVKAPVNDAAKRLGGMSPFEGSGELAADSGVNKSAPDVDALLGLNPVFAPVGIETIIGFDSRVRTYTNTYPERAVALIVFDQGRCTGWFIGPDTVATAGHCVYDFQNGSWMTNVVVYPGYNYNTAPYGSCRYSWLASVNGWVNSGNENYDYGVVKLNCTVGNTVGWFGYWWQSTTLTNEPAIVSGYPGDKSLTQWWSFDKVRVTGTRQLFYYNDTIEGMSGSPVWNDRPPGSAFCANGPCAMAIHAYGLHGSGNHNIYNHGTRIVEAVFNNLVNWTNAPR